MSPWKERAIRLSKDEEITRRMEAVIASMADHRSTTCSTQCMNEITETHLMEKWLDVTTL